MKPIFSSAYEILWKNTILQKKRKMKLLLPAICMFFFFASSIAQEKNNFEDWKIKPPVVFTKADHLPPSDAIDLFEGNSLKQWRYADDSPVQWNIEKNTFSVTTDEPDIFTKQNFGSCQLHVEWNVPDDETHDNLNWGNSGIYLMGLYEVQIYDSYNDKHKIYYNGQAGSIYKQHPPLVNSSKPAGEWQTFDVIFTAPVFKSDESLKSAAYITVFQNGILIQNHVELIGPTTHGNFTEYKFHPPKLPVMIQSHGSKVS
jgi:hypothetical protein